MRECRLVILKDGWLDRGLADVRKRVIHGKQLSVEGLEPGDLTLRGSLQGSKTHRESGKSALKLRDQTITQRVSAEIKGA